MPVTVRSPLTGPALRRLLSTAILAVGAAAADAATYSIHDLGTPMKYEDSSFIDMNDSGQLLFEGYSGEREGVKSRSFLWDPVKGLVNLARATGKGTSVNATAINNKGQVVGVRHGSKASRAFIWDEKRGFRYLGDLPGGRRESYAADINDAGQVVGYSHSDTGDRAFLWDRKHGMMDLGDLPGGRDRSYATGINGKGQVVGYSFTDDGERAFRWSGGKGMVDLGVLHNGRESRAYGINEKGHVVGVSVGGDRRNDEYAYLWKRKHGLIELSDPSGRNRAGASSISEDGLIVGWAGFGATLWDHDLDPIDPFALSDTGSLDSLGAYVINARGQIGGTAWDSDWTRAYVATPIEPPAARTTFSAPAPVPVPPTLPLLALGLLALAAPALTLRERRARS